MTRAAYADFLAIYTGAAIEAARLRHGEIDTDHLLLGMLAAGRDDARRLAAQGVTLAAAREACVGLQRDDLGLLGVVVPVGADANATAADLADRVPGMRLTPRAEAALAGMRDGDLLARLVADDRVRRLVTAAGGDPDAVAGEVVAGEGVAEARSEAGELRVEQWVSAAPAAVYALLDDPHAMVRWNSGLRAAAVDEDGVVRGDQASGWTGNRHTPARWVRAVATPLVEGRALVAWRLEAGRAVMVDAYTIEPDAGGTRVRLTRERRGRGPLAWVAARLSLVGMRQSLLGLAQAAG